MSERAIGDVNLQEVARVAGVSASTASRVLNGGSKRVSSDLDQRVKAVADSLGYVPSLSARALRGRRTAIILLVNDPRTASIAAIAAGMEEAGRAADVVVTVSATGPDPQARLAAIRTLRALNPKAFVVAASSLTGPGVSQEIHDELADFQRAGGGLVLVGDSDLPAPAIRFNDYESARVMGAYMGGLGRRRAAILTADHPALQYRTEGFLHGLASHSFRPQDVQVVECELSRQGGKAAALELAGLQTIPDLVLAGNDVLAIGALGGFRSAGLEVPADLALSGVDDIPLAQDVLPGLTTMAFPFMEAGRRALRLALAPSSPSEPEVHLRGALVVRGSTLPAIS
ncbi:LacI family DNA-binding transcriptional regulator [Paenarthrobacter aurescens]|jgi:LacI family transcriptional regulator|uniref:Transcriptional regulator, lacI family n=1 Tax=Paenarthrobacter aurescens (strain TC1) TaxID=290340 RepID=A1RDI2_PAEAT|nr:LacI family DNA-binding transcriptional regulator [Paenarthrobacter aurescens]ABM10843.1 putative transcriptional regulator, lacI family [Paenarthrobacter aurescens TC1]